MGRRAIHRVVAPMGVALVSLLYVCSGGCSSSSSLAGGGGCDSFCTKWVGARCRNGPTMERCLTECSDQQSRCLPETNAVLKCATIEAQIACETSSGEPRIVGCAPREAALDSCLRCDRFCQRWSTCPRGPSREECLASCLDPRCAGAHQSVLECRPSGEPICDATVGPTVPSMCMGPWFQAQSCTRVYGQEHPFRWLPVEPLTSDSGTGG